ncbi:MAG: S46 family peptidase [bacterium]
MKKKIIYLFVICFLEVQIFAQDIDYINSTKFGKMWSFDNIPIEKINDQYDVHLSPAWYNDVMQAALQLGNGCSASFVSENGLIMTNHHCVRDAIIKIQEDGEDFLTDGFYAEENNLERVIPGMFVDQLINVINITDEIITPDIVELNDNEQNKLIKTRVDSVEQKYNKKFGLICKIIPLYSGAKYVLHCYKRYTDLRLVMVPEFQIASTGWDWDNFTYPRYELDFAFLRAYDSLNVSCKTEKYFKWSKTGAEENELTFVIGRPGNTDRLFSSYQLKYLMDYQFAKRCLILNKTYSVYEYLYNINPAGETKYLNNLMGTGNSKKAYNGMLSALNDKQLFNEKIKTEENIQKIITSDNKLNNKYGFVFDALKTVFAELESIGNEFETLNNLKRANSLYLDVSLKVLYLTDQLLLPDSLRETDYFDCNIANTKQNLMPKKFDSTLQIKLLEAIIDYLQGNLGQNNFLFNLGSYSIENFVTELINNSCFSSKDKFEAMINKKPKEILNSNDPLLNFCKVYQTKMEKLLPKVNELISTIENLNRLLGEMYFEVYGSNFSPDATSTLRISDGVIKGYEYNGTIAPGKTTFFGMYDRYYSFGQKTYPWGLPVKWQNIEADFEYSTPLDFCSTHDIVGGNSGSAAINTNKEIIGLIFDGNYESLAGNFYYSPINNRAVGIDSKGLFYSLKKIYKATDLVNELSGDKK